MCVCVFSDCPGVTSADLDHLERFLRLRTLILNGVHASIINGQDGRGDSWGWMRNVSDSLKFLYISGELQRHIIHCRYRHYRFMIELTVGNQTTQD